MAIVRAPRPESGYLLLANEVAEDDRLSFAARGLLVYLLAKPDHWEVQLKNLINATANSAKPTGRDALRTLLAELQEVGYLRITQKRSQAGWFAYDYEVSEKPAKPEPERVSSRADLPSPDEPHTDKPAPARRATAKPSLSNNPRKTNTQGKQLPKKGGKPALTDMPDDFEPNEEHRKLAAESGADLGIAIKMCRLWHKKAGKQERDWNSAFELWLLRQQSFAKQQLGHDSQKGDYGDAAMDFLQKQGLA